MSIFTYNNLRKGEKWTKMTAISMYKKVAILMRQEDATAFKSRCAQYNVPMSSIIRPAIDEFMKTHPLKAPSKSLID